MKKWNETEIEFVDADSKIHKFVIIHNVVPIEGANSFMSFVEEWLNLTDDFTPESLCRYIIRKREIGVTNFYAFTKQHFEQLNKQQ